LINLISNAIKFTFDGSVELHVRLEGPDYIMFKVIDTGIGIKNKENLFKMFGKLERKSQKLTKHGVGLGLTISNNLVLALNDGDPEYHI